MIDTAQAHGVAALRGLTIALTRVIQANAFAVLFFDARFDRPPLGRVDQLLWDRDVRVTTQGKRLADLITERRRTDRIELAESAVIASIWEPWRLARAFQHLGRNASWGSWKQDENHHGVAWHPWPLIWIDNGNHSATAAMLKGGGEFRCEVSYDVSPLLRVVTTDGRFWYGEKKRTLGPVRSLPMAGIIEIGRRLVQMRRSRGRRRAQKIGGPVM